MPRLGRGLGGRELGFAQKNDANFSTTNTAATDITGVSVAFVAGIRPVSVILTVPDFNHSVANTLVLVQAIRTDTSSPICFIRGQHPTAGGRISGATLVGRMGGLTPGTTYTVKAQTLSGGAGTIVVFASGTGDANAMGVSLSVVER